VIVLESKLRTFASLTDDVTLLAYGAQHIGEGLPQNNRYLNTLALLRDDYERQLTAVGVGKTVTRNLIVRQLYRKNPDTIQTALKNEQPDVRCAAILVIAGRNLRST
jgi:hypothetical protein